MIETTYKCDICRRELDLEDFYGIHFTSDAVRMFKIVRPNDPTTRPQTHICKDCAKDIKEQT